MLEFYNFWKIMPKKYKYKFMSGQYKRITQKWLFKNRHRHKHSPFNVNLEARHSIVPSRRIPRTGGHVHSIFLRAAVFVSPALLTSFNILWTSTEHVLNNAFQIWKSSPQEHKLFNHFFQIFFRHSRQIMLLVSISPIYKPSTIELFTKRFYIILCKEWKYDEILKKKKIAICSFQTPK